MKLLYWFLIIFFFCHCEEIKTPGQEGVGFEKRDDVNFNWSKWKDESLPFDSIKINGHLDIFTTKKRLLTAFGKYSSVQNVDGNETIFHCNPLLDQGKVPIQHWYFGNTIFEVQGERAVLHTLDFKSTPVKLVGQGFEIVGNEHPSNLIGLFPESSKLVLPPGNAWSGFILIKASKAHASGLRWAFIYKGEQLTRVKLVSFGCVDRIY